MKKVFQWSFFVFLLGAITPAFSQFAWTPEQKAVCAKNNPVHFWKIPCVERSLVPL